MHYSCPPLSRANLSNYARVIRNSLGLDKCLYFPAEQFLEVLHQLIGDDDFSFEIVSDRKWDKSPSIHAYFDVDENCICILESVYEKACDGNGRDRMTLVHECAHVLLLKHSHLQLTRDFSGVIPAYMDPEWQAKCLAGELMVPRDLVVGMTAEEISVRCGVSMQAAKYQMKYNKKAKPVAWLGR